MQARNRSLLAALATSAALITSCSDEPGSPTPGGDFDQSSQPPAGQPTNGLPHSGAPKVDNPINTTRWESDPCAVITDGQLTSAGFPIPEGNPEDDEVVGPKCQWSWIDELSVFGGLFFTGVKDGLSHFYALDEAGQIKVLEPLEPIEGHPAVVAMQREDLRGEGGCEVHVGLRDDLVYSASITADSDSPWYDDPCKAAQELVTLAVQTMEGGA